MSKNEMVGFEVSQAEIDKYNSEYPISLFRAYAEATKRCIELAIKRRDEIVLEVFANL
jgi:hypothetical protein